MKKVSLSGSPRANVGKKDAVELRKQERVPCVLYGSGNQLHFHVKHEDLRKIVWSPDVAEIMLEIDGKQHRSILQEIQFHPVNEKLVHVDFLEVLPDKAVKMKIPVRITGTAEGVKQGGVMLQNFRKLHVQGLIDKIPDNVTLDITALEIGDSIRVNTIKADGVRFLDAPNAVVVSVQTSRKVVEEPTKEAVAAATTAAAAPAAEAKPAAEEKGKEKK